MNESVNQPIQALAPAPVHTGRLWKTLELRMLALALGIALTLSLLSPIS